jgi:hypothetical protein
MYNKFEIALIFKNCHNTQDVVKVNNAFNYLHAVAELPVPGYVYVWASARIRAVNK